MPAFVFAASAFEEPLARMVAREPAGVRRVLQFAERESRAGSYVAVMLSYEAAPAFDSVLTVHPPSDFPLAWAATFAGPSDPPARVNQTLPANPWAPRTSRLEYDQAVAKIKDLIAAGDTYQVNYSFPLTSDFDGDDYEWFRTLCDAQGAVYAAYLDLDRYKVLCLSPELFFERRGSHILTKPMKGTVRRGRWPAEDQHLRQWLEHSAKDRAENVMIVDLLRNDLGRVAVPGSVHVSSLYELERFETVWQMTSTVEATVPEETDLVQLMSALFPCGSITGAPKIRTMEIIRDLERFPRGAYTGAIGLLQPGGDCVFNVAIRTVVLDTRTGQATFGVGGGVTIDSTAEREYEECLVKSRFLHTSPVEFQLFESLLLEAGEYFLLEDHLERLRSSAAYFGFAFPEREIKDELERCATKHVRDSSKVRLSLWKDGRLAVVAEPITANAAIRRVVLATQSVDSSDRFLFHKTTNREFYEAQLLSQQTFDDIVFWNERGEVTESTIANLVASIDDELFTPPIESGLLAGTFRDHLIRTGKIKERVITIEELQQARELFLINSVRKWMKATLKD